MAKHVPLSIFRGVQGGGHDGVRHEHGARGGHQGQLRPLRGG